MQVDLAGRGFGEFTDHRSEHDASGDEVLTILLTAMTFGALVPGGREQVGPVAPERGPARVDDRSILSLICHGPADATRDYGALMNSVSADGPDGPGTASNTQDTTSGPDQDLAQALRLSWGPDTCAPEDVPDWSVHNPARGQCATTALVVHDHLGGTLMRGEVLVDGTQVDFHWWNRLPGGREVDLTREQFGAHESITPGTPVERPTRQTRMDREYGLLRDRVSAITGSPTA